MKIKSILQLYEHLPNHEMVMVDVLRQLTIDSLPAHCIEKISYNVPFFRGNKEIIPIEYEDNSVLVKTY